MKKIILLFTVLVYMPLLAQFEVKGNFVNYNDQPIIVKVYRDGVLAVVQRAMTNTAGDFSFDFSQPYNGLIILELSNRSYQLLADNNTIHFSTNYTDPTNQIKFSGGINADYNSYLAVADKKELANNHLKILLDMYQPQEQFYKDLQKEIARIEALPIPKFSNQYLNYYINSKEYLNNIDTEGKSSSVIMNEIEKRLLNDGTELETFGFLNDFVIRYVSYATYGAKTKEDAGDRMYKAIEHILNELGEDTSRGQSTIAISISLLKSNGFNTVAKKLNDKAESLTCEINTALADVIKKPLKKGEIAPNIQFSKTMKGVNSLYELKNKRKLVIFWGSWCPHCRKEIPYIKDFYKGFKKAGGEIVTYALDLEVSDYMPLVKDANFITDSDLLKWDSPVASAYGVNATPTMFMLDENNKVIQVGTKVSEFINF